jgi:hypothetical protein
MSAWWSDLQFQLHLSSWLLHHTSSPFIILHYFLLLRAAFEVKYSPRNLSIGGQYCGPYFTCRVSEPLLSQVVGSEASCEAREHGPVTRLAAHCGRTADLHCRSDASTAAGEV